MKILLATTAMIAAASGAMAQGFSGATVGLDYKTFSDFDDLDTYLLSGSVEYGLGNGFAVAAYLSVLNYAEFDENVTNVILRGIYAVSPEVKAGLFIGRETIEDVDFDIYGIEAAYDVVGFGLQGYIGVGELDTGFGGLDLNYLGVSGDYGLGNGFSVIGSYDQVKFEDGPEATISATEIGVEYAFGNGPAVNASLGRLALSAPGISDSEDYVKVGLTYSFGPQGGTTFGKRSFFDIVPGF